MSYLVTLEREGEGFRDKTGTWYPDAISALGGLLGFCGCGQPEAALRYVRDALRLVALESPDDSPTWDNWYDTVYLPAVRAVFKENIGAEYLMWYLLTDKELLEHGGSVPGWLTDLGERVLADLNTLNLEDA